jgi:G:T/U-mismatch repair DNA glycosylase
VNDFEEFFISHTAIRAVFFNGGAAERLYKRNVLSKDMKHNDKLHYHRLPSSSPAYASMPYQEKARQWRIILDYLGNL